MKTNGFADLAAREICDENAVIRQYAAGLRVYDDIAGSRIEMAKLESEPLLKVRPTPLSMYADIILRHYDEAERDLIVELS